MVGVSRAAPIIGASPLFSVVLAVIILGAVSYRNVRDDYLRAPRRAWIVAALAGPGSTWGLAFWFLALDRAPMVLVTPVTGIYLLVSLSPWR